MDDARMLTSRRAISLALVSALLGAGATLLVVKHPFTDEGGLRLLGSHGPGRADHGVPPGWSHGDKTGWRGGSVPPGWAKHDRSASKQHGPDDHGKSEDRGRPKGKRDHDHHGPKPGQGKHGH